MSFANVTTNDTVGEVADITEVLDVYKVNGNTADEADLTEANKLGTMASLMSQGYIGEKDGVLAPNGEADSSDTFTLVIKMQENAGNEYQGATVTFDIVAKATQAAKEADGFNSSDYDADAVYEQVNVDADGSAAENGAALKEAIANAPEGATIFVSAGKYDMTTTASSNTQHKGGFIVTTPNITIKGEAGTVISAQTTGGNGGNWEGINQQNTFTVAADNVTLDSLTFKPIEMVTSGNSIAPKALEVTNAATSVTIKNCTFESMTMSGEYVDTFGENYGGQISINTSKDSNKDTVKILNNTFNYAVLDLRTAATIEGNTFNYGSGVYHAAAIRFRAQFDGTGNNQLHSDVVMNNNTFTNFKQNPTLNEDAYVMIVAKALTLDASVASPLGEPVKLGNADGKWIIDNTDAYWYHAYPVK